MATFFLLIIYLAFISLGLPDSLLGVAWPLMRTEYGSPFEAAGLISMFTAGGTIVSSFASGAVHKRLSTGKITLISCLMTASSLLGFAYSQSFVWLLVLAVPLGLGGGSVDAALNNYVANHYKAHHMSWLHCFWGIGATLGPFIMSRYISGHNSWRSGYFTVSMVQFTLAAILLLALPLWTRLAREEHGITEGHEVAGEITASERTNPLKIRGVKLSLAAFLFYCGVEATIGLWGSSFLVGIKSLPAAIAAQWVSLYYLGITLGRLLTGFITMKLSNRLLIRIGQIVALAGVSLLLLPLPDYFSMLGFILVGLGCAPIFPCMLHETPARFGKANSQSIMGYQMALAYTGSTFLPPILGFIAAHTTIGLLPVFVLFYILIMLVCSERISRLIKA